MFSSFSIFRFQPKVEPWNDFLLEGARVGHGAFHCEGFQCYRARHDAGNVRTAIHKHRARYSFPPSHFCSAWVFLSRQTQSAQEFLFLTLQWSFIYFQDTGIFTCWITWGPWCRLPPSLFMSPSSDECPHILCHMKKYNLVNMTGRRHMVRVFSCQFASNVTLSEGCHNVMDSISRVSLMSLTKIFFLV
jgi:hypothetical protein